MTHAILRTLALAGLVLALPACGIAQSGSAARDALHPFPPAQAGMERWVINLPPGSDENALKLELLVGRTQDADCNNAWIIGKLEARTVQGWGYEYLQLQTQGQVASTRIGCPANSVRPRFIPVRADGGLRPYNSRLPLVVYTPAGYEVRYRVWRADAETSGAQRR